MSKSFIVSFSPGNFFTSNNIHGNKQIHVSEYNLIGQKLNLLFRSLLNNHSDFDDGIRIIAIKFHNLAKYFHQNHVF